MAVSKTGIAQLFNIGGGNSQNAVPSFEGSEDIIIARVVDISLNSNSELFESTGGWSGIGTINFNKIRTSTSPTIKQNTLSLATPLFPNIKNYPLVNEIVVILKGPNNVSPDILPTNKYFYVTAASLWNSQHTNAYPDGITSDNNISPSLNKPYNSIERGNVARNTTKEQSIDLNGNSGGKFEEKGDIQPILPFAGDNIFEGRFGNSIRLGSTSKSGGDIQNNWSKGNNTENGDPITILKNGQPENNSPGYLPIVENINTDPSSLYLTSTQNIPIDISVSNKKEGQGATIPYSNIITPVPKSPKSYNDSQVILNSGRLLFNTHTDSILFSSQKSIVLTSIEDLGIQSQTKNVNIVSNKGIVSLGQQNATQAVVLGDLFIEDFVAVLNNLINLCTALGNEPSISAASSLANIISQPGGSLDSILNRAKAGVHKSNKVKTS